MNFEQFKHIVAQSARRTCMNTSSKFTLISCISYGLHNILGQHTSHKQDFTLITWLILSMNFISILYYYLLCLINKITYDARHALECITPHSVPAAPNSSPSAAALGCCKWSPKFFLSPDFGSFKPTYFQHA